jgi:hypothetical protein
MNRAVLARGLMVIGFAAAGIGCSGTTWQRVQVNPGYQPPKEVKIAVVAQSGGEHLTEAVGQLQQALADEFASQGVKATFVQTAAEMPSTELNVVEWDQGSRALRWLGLGGGEGHIVVVVKSAAGLDGQARGFVRSGWFGGSSYNAAIDAGHHIARTISTGKP